MSKDVSNVEIVQNFFKAIQSGDLPGGLALLSPDVTWVYHGPDHLPFAGTFHGRDGVTRFFTAALELLEIEKMEVEAVEAVDDVLFIRGREHSRVRATNARYDIPWLHRISIKNGQIATYDEYLDTGSVLVALRAGA